MQQENIRYFPTHGYLYPEKIKSSMKNKTKKKQLNLQHLCFYKKFENVFLVHV